MRRLGIGESDRSHGVRATPPNLERPARLPHLISPHSVFIQFLRFLASTPAPASSTLDLGFPRRLLLSFVADWVAVVVVGLRCMCILIACIYNTYCVRS